MCVVQIQPRKHRAYHADYTASTRQHELDHTDHTDHTDHKYACPERSRASKDLSGVWILGTVA